MKSKKVLVNLFLAISMASAQDFSLVTERIGGAAKAGELNTFTARVLGSSGDEVYRVTRPLPFDVPFPAPYFSKNTGMLILAFPFDGFAEIYKNEGEKSAIIRFFKDLPPNYERTITCAIGKSRLIFLTSDVKLVHARVSAFSLEGRPLWDKELPFRLGYEIGMSPDESLIIAGSYETTEKGPSHASTILNHNGEETASVDFLFRKISFGPENTFLLSSCDEVISIDPGAGKEIWRWRNREPNSGIGDVLWMDSNFVVQTAEIRYGSDGGFILANPRFYFFTKMYLPDGEASLTGVTYQTSSVRYDGRDLILDLDGVKQIISRER